jgi:3-carboxy-cis,cis-muconate cycloisomerase
LEETQLREPSALDLIRGERDKAAFGPKTRKGVRQMTGSLTSSGLFGRYLHDPDIADLFGQPAFLAAMLRFERAWTSALRDTGSVSVQDADRALAAIDAFAPDIAALGLGAERDGMPVPELVRALRSSLGGAAPAIHTGATSQDVIDTAMVLTLQAAAAMIADRLAKSRAHLARLKERYGAGTLTGRTRMQAARTIPVAARLTVWSNTLQEAGDTLATASASLAVQIGGAVGLRDGDKGDEIAAHVARTLGLKLTPVWHADRQAMVSYGHGLSLVTGALGKIGQDVVLMAQQGIGEIALKGGGTSSVMPHKQNPVGAEALVALARYVAGQQGILAQALIHEQERSGAAWALEWVTLPAMTEACGAAARHADNLLGSIERIGMDNGA